MKAINLQKSTRPNLNVQSQDSEARMYSRKTCFTVLFESGWNEATVLTSGSHWVKWIWVYTKLYALYYFWRYINRVSVYLLLFFSLTFKWWLKLHRPTSASRKSNKLSYRPNDGLKGNVGNQRKRKSCNRKICARSRKQAEESLVEGNSQEESMPTSISKDISSHQQKVSWVYQLMQYMLF